MNTARIDALVDEVLPAIVELRRAIHQHPELSNQEFDTAARVRQALAVTPVEWAPPLLETDAVGMLAGRGAGRNVTLRADMDALPIQEETDVPYRSRKPGIMHACGHDGHTAMLAGAALVLSRLRDQFDGTIRFVFQPGEEVGAGRALIAGGILRNPPPAAVLALHAWPWADVGRVGARAGVLMGATDFFRITIRGQGGHAARPEHTHDTVLTACRIVEAFQGIIARRIRALDPAVISVCRIAGGHNANVIPETTELEGSLRYLDAGVGDALRQHMDAVIKGICLTTGARYTFSCENRFLVTVNTPEIVHAAAALTRTALGADTWFDLPEPVMGSEDFSFFLQDHPGAMFRLGMGLNRDLLHTPRFDFNDGALRNGIRFHVHMALRVLAGA